MSQVLPKSRHILFPELKREAWFPPGLQTITELTNFRLLGIGANGKMLFTNLTFPMRDRCAHPRLQTARESFMLTLKVTATVTSLSALSSHVKFTQIILTLVLKSRYSGSKSME